MEMGRGVPERGGLKPIGSESGGLGAKGSGLNTMQKMSYLLWGRELVTSLERNTRHFALESNHPYPIQWSIWMLRTLRFTCVPKGTRGWLMPSQQAPPHPPYIAYHPVLAWKLRACRENFVL